MTNLVPGSITNTAALSDLNEILLYIGGYDRARAVRFAGAFRVTVENLVVMPFMGSPREVSGERLRGLRAWPVQDFKAYIIYYRPFASGDGVEIVRVLHHSRDFETHLTDDTTFADA